MLLIILILHILLILIRDSFLEGLIHYFFLYQFYLTKAIPNIVLFKSYLNVDVDKAKISEAD